MGILYSTNLDVIFLTYYGMVWALIKYSMLLYHMSEESAKSHAASDARN
jgi:hypothetical protein